MKIDAVAYCRYSSDNQREESITAQKRAIEKYCQENNYNLTAVYADNALSGTSTDDRIEFKKMLNDSSKKLFEIVIVHKLDRFARNRYDSAIAKKRLRDNNVRVLSVLENLNGSPEAIITESILEGMAEYYSANLSREVKKGYNENVIQGKYCGGIIPLGLKKDSKGFYQIDSKTAEIVKELFSMRALNTPYIEITNYLHKEHNIKYGIQVIKNLLSNEKYIGILRHGKAVNDKGIPPIIDEELFYKVQEIRKNRTPAKVDDQTRIYYLTGIFTCGICGAPISGGRVQLSRDGTRHYYYKCGTRNSQGKCNLLPLNKNKIEIFVINFIKNSILSDKVLNNIMEKISDNIKHIKGKQYQINEFNNEIKKLNQRKKKLLNLLLDENITKEIYKSSNTEIDITIKIFENKIKKLETSTDVLDPKKIKKYLLKLRKELEKNDTNILKGVINTFIDEIILDNETLKINYSITNGIVEESKTSIFHRDIFKNYRTK